MQFYISSLLIIYIVLYALYDFEEPKNEVSCFLFAVLAPKIGIFQELFKSSEVKFLQGKKKFYFPEF